MPVKGKLYRSYKLFTVYVAPILAATVIFLDWFHTYQWKKEGRPVHPVLRAIQANDVTRVVRNEAS